MVKNKIAKLYPRDERALMALSRCGHVSHSNLNTLIANKRIDGYIKDGLIQKDVFNTNNNKNFTGYKLTSTGRKLVERQFGFKEHQIAQSLKHDVAISDKYFSLKEEQQETWKTETTLRREFKEELEHIRERDLDRYEEITHKIEREEISTIDATYVSEGEIVMGFEVVTNNYGQAEIQAKQEFCQVLKLEYEQRRV